MKYKHLIRATKYIWNSQKQFIIISSLFSLLIGISPYFSLWITKELFNEIGYFLGDGSASLSKIIILLSAQFTFQIYNSSLTYIDQYIEKKNLLLLGHNLNLDLFEKISRIPLLKFDDPSFHDHMNRMDNLALLYWSPLRLIKEGIQTTLNIISFATILISIDWIILLICIVVTIPLFFIQAYLSKEQFRLVLDTSSTNKELGFLSYLLRNRQYAKELSVFNLYKYFSSKWSNKYQENSKRAISLTKKQIKIEISIELITSVIYIFTSGLVLKILKSTKGVLIGDYVVINQALLSIQGSFSRLTVLYADIRTSTYFLEDQHKLMELAESNISLPIEESSSQHSYIEFNNLNFKYPNQTVNALKDINITIERGSKVAVLGANGSGKSTLIKCLVGLYMEYSGNIFIEKTNHKLIPKDKLREKFSVIFQDYIKYPYSIKDNIVVGDTQKEIDMDKIRESTKKSGMDDLIMNIPGKYETFLGNFIESGIDFSEGQWQKLAISRAFFRDAEIFVFDEPTASLDSESEIQIYKDLINNTEGKTVLFISHRISTAEYADQIIIMKNGRIIEHGTHSYLIDKRGEYYRLVTMNQNKNSTKKEVQNVEHAILYNA